MAVIDELVTLLDIKLSAGALTRVKSVTKAIGSVTDSAVKIGGALSAAGASLAVLSTNTTRNINLQYKFATSIGASYQNMQALQFATKLSGGSAEGLSSSLATLSKELNPQLPGEYNQVLYLMGIRTRNVDDAVLQLSDTFQKFSNIQALTIGEKLGLTPAFIRVLQTGRQGIASLSAQAKLLGAIITPDQVKASIKFDRSVVRMKVALSSITRVVAAGLAPAMEKLNLNFLNFLVNNRALISTNIENFVSGVTRGFGDISSGAVKASHALAALDTAILGSSDAGHDFSRIIEATTVVALGAMTIRVALLTSKLLGLTSALSAARGLLLAFPVASAYGALAIGSHAVAAHDTAALNNRASALTQARDLGYAGKTGKDAVIARARSLGSYIPASASPGGVLSDGDPALDTLQVPSITKQKVNMFHIKASAQPGPSSTTINVTQNINGAQNPTLVAQEVHRNLSGLSQSVHKTAGGFNRGTVS